MVNYKLPPSSLLFKITLIYLYCKKCHIYLDVLVCWAQWFVFVIKLNVMAFLCILCAIAYITDLIVFCGET